jgi:predicted PilT family ATPase
MREAVGGAVSAIQGIVADAKFREKCQASEEEVEVESGFIGTVIGKGGWRLKELEEQFGVSINCHNHTFIVRYWEHGESVALDEMREAVGGAVSAIQGIVADAECNNDW